MSSESQRVESSGDDAGYESLRNHPPSSQASIVPSVQSQMHQAIPQEPRYASLGIDSRKKPLPLINNITNPIYFLRIIPFRIL